MPVEGRRVPGSTKPHGTGRVLSPDAIQTGRSEGDHRSSPQTGANRLSSPQDQGAFRRQRFLRMPTSVIGNEPRIVSGHKRNPSASHSLRHPSAGDGFLRSLARLRFTDIFNVNIPPWGRNAYHRTLSGVLTVSLTIPGNLNFLRGNPHYRLSTVFRGMYRCLIQQRTKRAIRAC
jgi:hypothetical protein